MPPWGDTTSNMSMLSCWYSVITVILMKAEGNIFYPLVVSYWKQSQRGKERGAHSWYICVRTGEKEDSTHNEQTLQETL